MLVKPIFFLEVIPHFFYSRCDEKNVQRDLFLATMMIQTLAITNLSHFHVVTSHKITFACDILLERLFKTSISILQNSTSI